MDDATLEFQVLPAQIVVYKRLCQNAGASILPYAIGGTRGAMGLNSFLLEGDKGHEGLKAMKTMKL